MTESFEAEISIDPWLYNVEVSGSAGGLSRYAFIFFILALLSAYLVATFTKGCFALLVPILKTHVHDFLDRRGVLTDGKPHKYEPILVYVAQTFFYLLLASTLLVLILMVAETDGLGTFTTITLLQVFTAGWAILTYIAISRETSWVTLYPMHSALISFIMVDAVSFLFVQLFGQRQSGDLSYRASGTLWITVSLAPLFLYSGGASQQSADTKKLLATHRVNFLRIDSVYHSGVVESMFNLCCSCGSAEKDENGGDESADSGTDAPPPIAAGSYSSPGNVMDWKSAGGSPSHREGTSTPFQRFAKGLRKTLGRSCNCCDGFLDDYLADIALWTFSLLPILSFSIIYMKRDNISLQSQGAAIVVLCVCILNELCSGVLRIATPALFSLVIFERYLIVLCGDTHWLLGAGLVLLLSSSILASQIVNHHFPDPASKASAMMCAMEDMVKKGKEVQSLVHKEEVQARKAAFVAHELEEHTSFKAGEDIERMMQEAEANYAAISASAAATADDDVNAAAADAGPSTDVRGATKTAPEKARPSTSGVSTFFLSHDDSSRSLDEDDKKEENAKAFKRQLFALLCMQVAMAIAVVLGYFQPWSLHLDLIWSSSQIAWVGLIWSLWLFCLLAALVMHARRSGGFGSLRSVLAELLDSTGDSYGMENDDDKDNLEMSSLNTSDSLASGKSDNSVGSGEVLAASASASASDTVTDPLGLGYKDAIKKASEAAAKSAENGNTDSNNSNSTVDGYQPGMATRLMYGISDLLQPNLEGRGYVGFLVFMTWCTLVGCAAFAAYLTEIWLLVPFVGITPYSIYSFLMFRTRWELRGCPVPMCFREKSKSDSSTDDVKAKSETQADAGTETDTKQAENVPTGIGSEKVTAPAAEGPHSAKYSSKSGGFPTYEIARAGASTGNDNASDKETSADAGASVDNESAFTIFCQRVSETLIWMRAPFTLRHSLAMFLLPYFICIPFDYISIAIDVGLWVLTAALSIIALTYWRVTIAFNKSLLCLVLCSWVPTVTWAVINGIQTNNSDVLGKENIPLTLSVILLTAATSAQLFLLTAVFWRDCYKRHLSGKRFPAPDNSTSLAITKKEEETGSDVENSVDSAAASKSAGDVDSDAKGNGREEEASGDNKDVATLSAKSCMCFLRKYNCCGVVSVEILGFDAASHGTAFPVRLIFWSLTAAAVMAAVVIVFLGIWYSGKISIGLAVATFFALIFIYSRLEVFQVIEFYISEHTKKYFGIAFVTIPFMFIAGCSIAGAVASPVHTFWWLSVGWVCSAFLFLLYGAWTSYYGPRLAYHSSFFPVYKADPITWNVTDASLEASPVLLFTFFIGTWAVWGSIIVSPTEYGVVLYVVSFACASLYMKFVCEDIWLSHLASEIDRGILTQALDAAMDHLYQRVQVLEGGSSAGPDDSADKTNESSVIATLPGTDKTESSDTTWKTAAEAIRVQAELEMRQKNYRNFRAIEDLVTERDKSIVAISSLVSTTCTGALGMVPIRNAVHGYRSGIFKSEMSEEEKEKLKGRDGDVENPSACTDTNVATTAEEEVESEVIVSWSEFDEDCAKMIGAHNDCVNIASKLDKLAALAKLKALALASSSLRVRENNLVEFLRSTQPSMAMITVEELSYLPYSLVSDLMGSFKAYTAHMQEFDEQQKLKARAEEKIAQVKDDFRRWQQAVNRKAFEEKLRLEKIQRDKDAEEEKQRKEKEEAARKKKEAENIAAGKGKGDLPAPAGTNTDVLVVSGPTVQAPPTGAISVVTTFGAVISDDVNSVLKTITFKDGKFTDQDFHGKDAVLGDGEDKLLSKSAGWGNGLDLFRLSLIKPNLANEVDVKMCTAKNVPPNAGDIMQGGLGDCYLLSALSTVSERPDLVENLIVHADPAKGLYVLKLWFNGAFRCIVLDDYFPINCSRNWLGGKTHDTKQKLAFQQYESARNLYVCLVEKAYAKLHGSYQQIVGGFEDAAMADLTGGIPMRMRDLGKDQDKSWNQVKLMHEQGHLLGAGSISGKDTEHTDNGIVKGHAYSILDVRELDDHRIMKMRNPWGKFEWTGRWGDKSAEWTPRYKKLLNHDTTADDGCFWLAFEDFVKYFRNLYCCKLVGKQHRAEVAGEWKGKTTGGAQPFESWKNPQYLLCVGSSCRVTVLLSQDEVVDHKHPGKFVDVEPMGLAAYHVVTKRHSAGSKAPEPLPNRHHRPFQHSSRVAETQYGYERDTNLDFEVKEGDTVTLVPALFNTGKEGSFKMRVYASKGECSVTLLTGGIR